MLYPETFAIRFAQTLDLFATGASKEDQKQEFRALLSLLGDSEVRLVDSGDSLRVNNVPVSFPALQRLFERLRSHGVSLLQVLGGAVDVDVVQHLEETRSDTVTVVPAAPRTDEEDIETAPEVSEPISPITSTPLAAETLPQIRSTIEALEQDPDSAQAPDLLEVLVKEVQQAVAGNWLPQALTAAQAVLRVGAHVKNQNIRYIYDRARRTVLSPSFLQAYARAAVDDKYRAASVEVLQSAEAQGTETLLELLISAPGKQERLAYLGVLTEMRHGLERVIGMLDHPQWYVVRNVAELCGELRLKAAVPSLGKLLNHDDSRLRRASGYALGRIGTLDALEHFRRALRDKDSDVRRHSLVGIGGAEGSPLVMFLANRLDEEPDGDVRRELLFALGRVGTADAVEVLSKAAAPGGRLFGRKPSKLRVAATEALGLARSGISESLLKKLATDDSPEVQVAAERALRGDVTETSWSEDDHEAPRVSRARHLSRDGADGLPSS
jgi:hypothetical protein